MGCSFERCHHGNMLPGMHVQELLTEGDGCSMLKVERARRALGDAQFKAAKGKEGNLVECTPEVRRIELQRGDAGLILASDGLWDVLSDSAAVGVLDQARAPVRVKISRRCISSCNDDLLPGGMPLGGLPGVSWAGRALTLRWACLSACRRSASACVRAPEALLAGEMHRKHRDECIAGA